MSFLHLLVQLHLDVRLHVLPMLIELASQNHDLTVELCPLSRQLILEVRRGAPAHFLNVVTHLLARHHRYGRSHLGQSRSSGG